MYGGQMIRVILIQLYIFNYNIIEWLTSDLIPKIVISNIDTKNFYFAESEIKLKVEIVQKIEHDS